MSSCPFLKLGMGGELRTTRDSRDYRVSHGSLSLLMHHPVGSSSAGSLAGRWEIQRGELVEQVLLYTTSNLAWRNRHTHTIIPKTCGARIKNSFMISLAESRNSNKGWIKNAISAVWLNFIFRSNFSRVLWTIKLWPRKKKLRGRWRNVQALKLYNVWQMCSCSWKCCRAAGHLQIKMIIIISWTSYTWRSAWEGAAGLNGKMMRRTSR